MAAPDPICAAAEVTCEGVVMTLALSERDRERLSLFVDEMRAMRADRGWSQSGASRPGAVLGITDSDGGDLPARPNPEPGQGPGPSVRDPGVHRGRAGKTGDARHVWAAVAQAPHNIVPGAVPPVSLEIEAKATVLRAFEHSLVPGLLQTEDYARARPVHQVGCDRGRD